MLPLTNSENQREDQLGDRMPTKRTFTKRRTIAFAATTVIAVLILLVGLALRNNIGLLPFLRDVGLIKVTSSGFFDAMESQDLTYDYNGDGVVSGEDYSLMEEAESQETPDASVETTGEETEIAMATADSAGGGTATGVELPSVRGFYANEFMGTVNVNYPLDLPSGPADFAPLLTLSYSSENVDNIQMGTSLIL